MVCPQRKTLGFEVDITILSGRDQGVVLFFHGSILFIWGYIQYPQMKRILGKLTVQSVADHFRLWCGFYALLRADTSSRIIGTYTVCSFFFYKQCDSHNNATLHHESMAKIIRKRYTLVFPPRLSHANGHLFTFTQQLKVFLGPLLQYNCRLCCSGRQIAVPPPLAEISRNKSPLTVGKLCHRCYIVDESTY